MAHHQRALIVGLRSDQLTRIHDERIQDEARVAAEIRRQHPDVSRSDALKAAARIVQSDYQAGRKPA